MISNVARAYLKKGPVKNSNQFWNSLAGLADKFGIDKVESDTFHPNLLSVLVLPRLLQTCFV